MKRFLALLLAMILCLSMFACSNDSSWEEDEEDEEQSDKDDSKDNSKITIEEQVIYDQNDVKITVTGFAPYEPMGPAIKLKIENKSSATFTLNADNCSVNDLMVNSLLYLDIAAGSTVEDTLTLMKASLTDSGITVVQKIEFELTFKAPETYEVIFPAHPVKLTTSADPDYQQKNDDSGFTVLNDDNIRFIVQGTRYNTSRERTEIVVFIENKSQKNWTIQVASATLNGITVDPIFSTGVVAGKGAYDTIIISKEELEANSITDFNTLELAIRVVDFENFANSYTTDSVNVNFAELDK